MMNLTHYSPARDLLGIADDMNRLVNSFFSKEPRETSLFQGSWSPNVDISEDENNFYLKADLPGMDREDVKVRFEDGLLTITGEKKSEVEKKDVDYHRVERAYGKFERSFRVPTQIVTEKIDAKFDKGVLTITMPKAEEVKPKEIEVKIS